MNEFLREASYPLGWALSLRDFARAQIIRLTDDIEFGWVDLDLGPRLAQTRLASVD